MTMLDQDWLRHYPQELVQALARAAGQSGAVFYFSGGTVRDWLQGRPGSDIDITTDKGGAAAARELARQLGGRYVLLDEKEDAARVVWQGQQVDFSGFREGAESISDDLRKRDFTINALAIRFAAAGDLRPEPQKTFEIIDPTGGLLDLRARLVRCTSPAVFDKDPLRLLRAYRFMALPGFAIETATEAELGRQVSMINRVAAERLNNELALIMESDRAAELMNRMVGSGLLQQIFPELFRGKGMAQPDSHHLDVFEHSLATLQCMEDVQQQPGRYYPGHEEGILSYLAAGKRRTWLKWAALFHDLGKPETRLVRAEKSGRITFYNHDLAGARRFVKIAENLRWSRLDTKQVAAFISLHMWPFHLQNVRRRSGLSPRACLRLAKAAGSELPGLFLLAMADSLAGKGDGRPAAMEENLAGLYDEVEQVYQVSIRPVLSAPRLLSGHDLIGLFGLRPGPRIGIILSELEKVQVEGRVGSREEALAWAGKYLSGFAAADK